MKYKINYTKSALTDLDGIYDYIAFSLKEPSIAENLIHTVLQSVRTLEQMPNRHHLCNEDILRSRNVRIMPVKNYIVAYSTDEQNGVVSIIRILYGGQDISKQLKDTI